MYFYISNYTIKYILMLPRTLLLILNLSHFIDICALPSWITCLVYIAPSLACLPWLSNMVIQFRTFPGTYERTVQIDSLKSNRKGKTETRAKSCQSDCQKFQTKKANKPKESSLSAVRWPTHTHSHTVAHTHVAHIKPIIKKRRKSSQLVVILWAFLLILGQERALNSSPGCPSGPSCPA